MPDRRHLLQALFATLQALACQEQPPAGHSRHGAPFHEGPRQAAYKIAGCGEVSFPVTCRTPEVQAFFDQGVGQLHGFWYFEAERSFRQVARLDPDCAMAFWGMAMANVENPQRAKGFVAEAVRRQDKATGRERLWIASLAKFHAAEVAGQPAWHARLRAWLPGADAARRRELVRSYEEIVKHDQGDIEALAFLANQIWLNSREGIEIQSHQAVDALLDKVFAKAPLHPAHHYRIHLWDDRDAVRAIASAAVCGQTAPAIAHQWHMSSHVFAKLHRHEDAAWHQIASARVDHAQMLRDRVMLYQIHNYGHNNEWLCRSLCHVGRPREALAIARNMVEQPRHPEHNDPGDGSSVAGHGMTRLLETCVDFGLVDELAQLDAQGMFEVDDERRELALAASLAEAFLLHGRLERGRALVGRVAALRQAPGGTAPGKWPRRSTVERRLAALHALLALAEGRLPEARAQLAQVRLRKLVLADAWLAAGCADKASEVLDAEAKQRPDRTEILARQVLCHHAAGDAERARVSFDRLRQVAGRAEDGVPLLERLAPVAAAFGCPRDWRQPQPPRADVGARPDLAGLGPFCWSPSPADDWELPSAGGGRVALREYRGRNVLVVFYLGFGCLHCVAQLRHLAPLAAAFREAGIEIVAVGSDTAAAMAEALAALAQGERFSFPLASDAKLEVFRRWRAYDDFEDKPLHGTFLVDAEGLVRWQDVGFEPFDQPAWLLAECRRLLRR